MKKINNKILTIAIAILTLISVGGLATIAQSPNGVYNDPDLRGPGN